MGLKNIKTVKYLFLTEPVYGKSVFRRLSALPSQKRAVCSRANSRDMRLVFRASPQPALGSPGVQARAKDDKGPVVPGRLPKASQGDQGASCHREAPLSPEPTEWEVKTLTQGHMVGLQEARMAPRPTCFPVQRLAPRGDEKLLDVGVGHGGDAFCGTPALGPAQIPVRRARGEKGSSPSREPVICAGGSLTTL